MKHNHVGYQRRLDFILDLFRELFGSERVDITPIQYDPDFPYKYNNFVYRVSLPDPLPEKREIGSQQPGTCAVPEGSQHFILRLTNRGAEDMNPETRVENEVAIISLAATALRSFEPHIVPSVYGWGSAASESAQGWILEEMMPGAPVDETFDNAPLEEKKDILNQIATILRALQSFQIPGSVTNFGGLTFGDSGKIVSAAMTTVGSGPWSTYEEYFHDEVKSALQKADKNPYIKGWHANGVRQRLEAFLESGIAAQFKCLENKNDRTIVHGDFTLNNMLYDPATKRITALLDYDFACIHHPSYEFLRSFSGAGGKLEGWSGSESHEETALRDAKLYGFPSPLPESTADGVDWIVAKVWEDELEKVNVERPRIMKGIEKVADVDAVLGSLLPWRVTNSDVLLMQSEQVIMKCRDENEVQLIKLMEHLGF